MNTKTSPHEKQKAGKPMSVFTKSILLYTKFHQGTATQIARGYGADFDKVRDALRTLRGKNLVAVDAEGIYSVIEDKIDV